MNFKEYTFKDILINKNKEKIMNNGNTIIAITGIVAATLFGIVALLVNSETKVNFNGTHNDSSVQVEIEQSQIPQQK
ncbi:MAG: hypothetical protein AAGA80_26505 [Cyanobacteria bacterium P01_F01_bin.143]